MGTVTCQVQGFEAVCTAHEALHLRQVVCMLPGHVYAVAHVRLQ